MDSTASSDCLALFASDDDSFGEEVRQEAQKFNQEAEKHKRGASTSASASTSSYIDQNGVPRPKMAPLARAFSDDTLDELEDATAVGGRPMPSYAAAQALADRRARRARAGRDKGAEACNPVGDRSETPDLLSSSESGRLRAEHERARAAREEKYARRNLPKDGYFLAEPGAATPPRTVGSPRGVIIGSSCLAHNTSSASSRESGEVTDGEGRADTWNLNASASSLNFSFPEHPGAGLNASASTSLDETAYEAGLREEEERAREGLELPRDTNVSLNSSFTDRLLAEESSATAQETPMDWENFDAGILQELEQCRKEVQGRTRTRRADGALESKGRRGRSPPTSKAKAMASSSKATIKVYVVVDTNIFISQLGVLRALLADECARGLATLHVPWTVLQELDALKGRGRDRDERARSARAAIRLLEEELDREKPKIVCQSLSEEASAQKYRSRCNDDAILQSCIQLTLAPDTKAAATLLYTQDKMLGIKARQCNIRATDSARLKENLDKVLQERRDNAPANNLRSRPDYESTRKILKARRGPSRKSPAARASTSSAVAEAEVGGGSRRQRSSSEAEKGKRRGNAEAEVGGDSRRRRSSSEAEKGKRRGTAEAEAGGKRGKRVEQQEPGHKQVDMMQAFQEIWGFLFSYTKFYMDRFRVDSSRFSGIEPPTRLPSAATACLDRHELKPHLDQLIGLTTTMQERMGSLFKIPPNRLPSCHDSQFQGFLDSLSSLPLCLGPRTPTALSAALPPPRLIVRAGQLRAVLAAPADREAVQQGHMQLREFNRILKACKRSLVTQQ